ncbi:MAG: type II toxin-antitoxin system Phd/YefM family antitoxin [Proteobacteria bacterium]|nr:type II toxin-antitoxin system Phd/YefM family antitoxin [Pseudomonadota bacterium]
MEKTLGVEEARKNLGYLVDDVRMRGEFYIISKKGKPAAAIVPLEVARKHQESKKALLRMIEEVHEKNKGMKADEIEKLISEAVRTVRILNVND